MSIPSSRGTKHGRFSTVPSFRGLKKVFFIDILSATYDYAGMVNICCECYLFYPENVA